MFPHHARLGNNARQCLSVILLVAVVSVRSPRIAAAQTQMPAGEYAALVALYESTDGAHWIIPWALPTEAPCDLYGVTCFDGHVTWLTLSGNGLAGPLPDALADLSGLETLLLANNRLSGTLPARIGNLTALREIDLTDCSVDGPVPPGITALALLGVPRTPGGSVSVDLSYNALWTDDPEVKAFLDARAPGWWSHQGYSGRIVSPDESITFGWMRLYGPTVIISIPAGAVTETVRLFLTWADPPPNVPEGPWFAPPASYLGRYAEDLISYDVQFQTPVTLTVMYLASEVGFEQDSLAIYLRENGTWTDAALSCSPPGSYTRSPGSTQLNVGLCRTGPLALGSEALYRVHLPLVARYP